MDWNARIRATLAASGHLPDDDVVEELAQQARAMYEAARKDGGSDADAERRVSEHVEQWRASAGALRHASRRAPAVEPPPAASASRFAGIAQDVSYATRLLTRQPRFALLVILTMALGIGASTMLFGVAYGVLIKPLPWPDADRLVVLKETRGGKAPRFGSFTNAAYLAWREEATTIQDIAAVSVRAFTLTGAGDPERVQVTAASASLFRVIGARPLIGSLFEEKDEAARVVVLSEGLWRQRFSGDPGVLGRAVHFDGTPYIIVGVLPDDIAYPDRLSRGWVPFRVAPATGNLLSLFEAVAKLRPGVTPAQAAAEGTGRGRFVADTGMTTMAIFGGGGKVEISATPLRDALTGDVRRPLFVLLGAVTLLLLIATTNVASLQLSRATARRRELAIRAALGASRARVLRQLVVESLLLGVLGGTAGIALAAVLQRGVPSILPADFPRIDDVGIDKTVVLFATIVSILVGVVFGLAPAFRIRRLNLVQSLAEDGVSPVGMGGRSGVARTRLMIIGGQVAVACVLLVGASLLGRSFVELLRADRGLDPSRVLSARVSLPAAAYTPERRYLLLGQILDRLSAAPGVRAVAFTSELPVIPGGSTAAFSLRPREAGSGVVTVQASPRTVSADYFAALDLKILAGRSLLPTDTETSEPVCVVNETFARRYLGGSPVGAKVPIAVWGREGDAEGTVVGVAEDVHYVGAPVTSLPEMYFSYRQFPGHVRMLVVTLLVRADQHRKVAATVRSVVRQADPGLVAEAVMTLEDRLLMTSLARPRLYAVLLGSFAFLALLVTGVGLFGVLSYTVSQRTRELGVRAALGARRRDLVVLVVRQGLGVTLAGLVVGLVASLWLTRFIATLLFGLTPNDSVTYLAVPAVVLVVAAIACVAPARRAAYLDPLRALRS